MASEDKTKDFIQHVLLGVSDDEVADMLAFVCDKSSPVEERQYVISLLALILDADIYSTSEAVAMILKVLLSSMDCSSVFTRFANLTDP